jgi:hypothetical protein
MRKKNGGEQSKELPKQKEEEAKNCFCGCGCMSINQLLKTEAPPE